MIDLTKLGIDGLNAMQQDAAQAFRRHDSLVLLSPTGSGKTLAYLLPLLESLNPREEVVQALVIVPSRELAMQTVSVARQACVDIRPLALYGGRPTMDEHRTISGSKPQLVVGTPGRLLDHLTKGNIDATTIRTLIIDEFDKCLELGFREEMTAIFSHLSNVSKRMLLSATDNPEITRFLPEYQRLDYLDDSIDERIQEWQVDSPLKDKLETLARLLLTCGQQTSLVFVGFRESVERVGKFLHEQGFYAALLHGGMEQRDRERNLFCFLSGSCNILVSTDLASRGLDIPALDNVIHYHLPLTDDVRTHRNGRTARWDREGRVFYIVGPEEKLEDSSVTPFSDLSRFPTQTDGHLLPVWETLYIGKGKKDKLSRGDIAGFLMKVGGLSREEIGLIDVRDHQSYAAISRLRLRETLQRIKGQKIKGIKTLFEVIRG